MESLFAAVLRVSVGLSTDPGAVASLARAAASGDGDSDGDGDAEGKDSELSLDEEAASMLAAEFYIEATARDLVSKCFEAAGATGDDELTVDQLRSWYARTHTHTHSSLSLCAGVVGLVCPVSTCVVTAHTGTRSTRMIPSP